MTRFILLVLFLLNSSLLFAQSVDPLTMTQDQVAKLPGSTVSVGIQQLSSLKTQEQAMYSQLKNFNTEMCKRLVELGAQCLSQAYLVLPQTDELGCGQTTPTPNPVIRVVATNLNGYKFRLFANKNYISDEFGEGGGVITFHRNDTQPITARFREITTLRLISVTSASTISKTGYIQSTKTMKAEDQQALIANMKFKILINDKPLIEDPAKEWLKIVPPVNATTLSELRVDPEDILKMGKNDKCVLNIAEVNQIRLTAESGGLK